MPGGGCFCLYCPTPYNIHYQLTINRTKLHDINEIRNQNMTKTTYYREIIIIPQINPLRHRGEFSYRVRCTVRMDTNEHKP